MNAVVTSQGLQRAADQTRAFRAHAAVFALSMIAIFSVNLLTNLAAGIATDVGAWWSAWALLGSGLGIGIHGLVLLLAVPNSPSEHSDREPPHVPQGGGS